MPILDHVRELRDRALRAVAGVLVGAIAGWFLYTPVFELLQRPIVALAHERDATLLINFSGVASSLNVQVMVALFAGVLLASPWWIYQLWAYVTPALTRKERRYTLGFLGAGVPLFLAGAAVAFWLLPKAVGILTGFTPEGAANIIDAQTYLGFIVRMVLAFGVAFLLPVVMVALMLTSVVTSRAWLHGWRWAVLLTALFAAIATPTGDALSMFVLMGPMVLLYFLAIGVGAFAERRRGRRLAKDLA